ncbi:MAG: DinB family protein [Gammaproteobacteria bacterium]|nr:DinB family protein [Gammaproteobacteria bacterium]
MLNQFKLFAEYNQLMNERIFSSAEQLSDEKLHQDCGAFFKSVFATLNHVMVGDVIWLNRFSKHSSSQTSLSYLASLSRPESLKSNLFSDLGSLKQEREKIDRIIIRWISGLSESDLDECIVYRSMAGLPFQKQFSSLISHLFLHQIHHRGQVTTMLSQFGVDFGETDIIEIVDECIA